MSTQGGYRYDALDGVRGLAAQVVLLGHAFELAFLSGPGPAAVLVSWFSRLAVMTFFCLSGFVIATSLVRLVAADRDRFLLPYAVHRVARIAPPLVAAVALTFVVGAIGRAGLPLVDLRAPDYAMGLAAFLRGITLTFATSDVTFALDGPLWSLRQEVWLYGIAALVALAAVKGGLARLAAAALVAGMVALTADRFFYLQSLALFGCGALAALFGADPRLMRAARSPWPAFALAAMALGPLAAKTLDAGFLADMSNAYAFLAWQAATGVPLALTLLGLALGSGGGASALAGLGGLAGFSYTLYVVHNPVLVLVFSLRAASGWLPGPWGAAIAFLVAVVTAEAIAWALARVVERPRVFRALAFRSLAAAGLGRLTRAA